jgi:1,4-dihydroxy-2-naphthoyl-CoA synthase
VAAAVVDVVVTDEGAAVAVVRAVEAHPLAATALALHLRASAALGIDDALVGESATYSLLQAGPEHRRWLAARPEAGPRADGGHRVSVERHDDRLTITLDRPAVRNAVDAAMQEALADALIAAAEPDVTEVVVRGAGASFSSGGDLREFGSLADPASAHLLRLARSPGRALARVAAKATVVVHGPCYGAGVELPAFAGRVIARPGTTFTLPEVSMGLVPGAGGTVSLPRRIGRHRTAWLALTGHPLDAATALDWGLVDEIAEPGPA